jgi:hypothetical protein
MIVYLAEYDGQGGYGPHFFVVGIYSSEAKAKEAIEEDFKGPNRKYHSRSYYNIHKHEVDK